MVKNLGGYCRKAIAYAEQAYNLMEELDITKGEESKKKVYALNQYLYYMIEFGGNDLKEKMRDMSSELSKYEEDPGLWNYRFDDTLARYNHRLALSAGNSRKWDEFMSYAIERSTKAKLRAHGDEIVTSYPQQLAWSREDGYRPKQKRSTKIA